MPESARFAVLNSIRYHALTMLGIKNDRNCRSTKGIGSSNMLERQDRTTATRLALCGRSSGIETPLDFRPIITSVDRKSAERAA